MDMSSAPTPRDAIEWQPPIINNVTSALDDAGCLIERIRALMASTISDMNEILLPDLAGHVQERGYQLFMIFMVVQEKLEEFDRLVGAITAAAYRDRRTSVAKHVDIMREREFRAAVDRLAAVRATPLTAENDEVIGTEASEAMSAIIAFRVTSPAQFREKMDIIRESQVFVGEEVMNALFADLDALGWTSAANLEA